MASVLFICRIGEDYNITEYGYFRKFSGLFNSARLVNEMLQDNDIISNIEVANDNNDIDRLVTKHKPDICVIEAYWVVPEKFAILSKLHPDITWVIRIHSEVPFWATEGMAMDWTLKYLEYPNVVLAPNAKRLFHDVKTVLSGKYDRETIDKKVIYLPNCYPLHKIHHIHKEVSCVLNVGCFGAIRPLKNQLIQAIAAIEYADKHHKELHFHINGNRVEGHGDPVLKNLRLLFKHSKKHKLVEHAWQPHKQFLEILSKMDIGLQVSFTESFNIITADMLAVGVPVVTSPEVAWISRLFQAEPTQTDSIVAAMERANLAGKYGVKYNRFLLSQFSLESECRWIIAINNQ